MHFPALHQALGLQPGLLTSQMLNDAVTAGIAESDQIDWKSQRAQERDLAQSDIPKDIAAFANSGGGILVFGITEVDKKATSWIDVGDVTENYERTLRRVAVQCIHPLVFGLDIVRIDDNGKWALAVVVPPSVDVTGTRALSWAGHNQGFHPLDTIDVLNVRRDLRRWVFISRAGLDPSLKTSMAIHDSGAVSIAHAVGGRRLPEPMADTVLPGNRIRSYDIECCVADFMAMLREYTTALGATSEWNQGGVQNLGAFQPPA